MEQTDEQEVTIKDLEKRRELAKREIQSLNAKLDKQKAVI